MNDDREVTCYALLVEHQNAHRQQGHAGLQGTRLRSLGRAARPRRRLQPDGDDAARGQGLQQRRRLATRAPGRRSRPPARRARGGRAGRADAADAGRQRASTNRRCTSTPAPPRRSRAQAEITTLALIRVAANEPDVAAALLTDKMAAAPAARPVGLGLVASRPQRGAAAGSQRLGALPHRLGRGRARQHHAGAGLERRHLRLGHARRAAQRRTAPSAGRRCSARSTT